MLHNTEEEGEKVLDERKLFEYNTTYKKDVVLSNLLSIGTKVSQFIIQCQFGRLFKQKIR